MNSFTEALYFFCFIMVELTILFISISTLVGFILQYLSEDKMQKWLSNKSIWGNFIGAAIGGITPFCACSTIPMTVGFLKARIPFGSVISFVVASPILNPIVLTMVAALMGVKSAIIYGAVTFSAAVLFGIALEKMGFEKQVKNVKISGQHIEKNQESTFSANLKVAFMSAMGEFRGVFLFLVVGVAVGAVIKGYIPQGMIASVAGPQNPAAVPVSALIGIPLYIRASTAIPIGLALMDKGMSVGAVIALIVGGAGMAIPEMSLLAGIFRIKLVIALVIVIFLTAVGAGIIFNIM